MEFNTAKEWRASWFGDWAAWRDKQSTRDALVLFDALKGSEAERMAALYRIGIACLDACRYDPEKDPGEIYRQQMAGERREAAALARAARELAKACERNSRAMGWALPGGNNRHGATLTRNPDGTSRLVIEMGAAWFFELEQSLRGKLPERDGGSFLEHYTVGNLHFDKRVKEGPPIEVASMLAFELAFYLRIFTAGRIGDSTQTGQPMPDDGKPCWPVVAAFCNATLGTQLDGKQVADRVTKLVKKRGVGLMPWPKIPTNSP